MKTKGCKAKGRVCCQQVKDLIHKYFPKLGLGDVFITPSSMTGEDIILSPYSRHFLPLTIECKNQEALSIWAALKQSEYHCKQTSESNIPVLFFRRNRSKLYAALDAEELMKLLAKASPTL